MADLQYIGVITQYELLFSAYSAHKQMFDIRQRLHLDGMFRMAQAFLKKHEEFGFNGKALFSPLQEASYELRCAVYYLRQVMPVTLDRILNE